MNNIPFTAYLRVVPDLGTGKRFEKRRSLERISADIYEDLKDVADINLAMPGSSGVSTSIVDDDSLSSLSDINAIRPQFGQFYNMITIIGFIKQTSNEYHYSEKQLLHAGESVSGPASGAPGYSDSTEPSATAITVIKSLKSKIESVLPTNAQLKKVSLNNIIWGEGGHHFPL